VTRGDPNFFIFSYSFSISRPYRIPQNISPFLVPISGVLAVGAGGPRPPQLAILGGRKNEKGAPIPRRILKLVGKNAFEKI
jgi:hypothetical protein